MTAAAQSLRENRLARESSPYLLQHKHNPVDWWAWGPDALAEAKHSNKPILLSFGHAACHWCHVMAHESFEDEDVARVMNELFVNIKVDREERPDIDQIYMSALHMLGEQGGWPLTMFLTPSGEPFWGGTYFPNTARYGRPAFTDVLREVARLFREEPSRIEHNRQALMERLPQGARAASRPGRDLEVGTRHARAASCGDHRSGSRRAQGCAEVSARGDFRAAVACRPAHRRGALFRSCRTHARTHLERRDLRSSRRRLFPLLGRRALARAAFRK